VAACGGGGHGNPQPDSPTPDAPLVPGPTLTARPGASVAHVSWTAVTGASSYNVYRSGAKGTQGALVQTVSATQLDDTSVTNFQPYWYEVTAVIDSVETAPSNQANAFGYDLTHWTVRHSAVPIDGMLFVPKASSPTGSDFYLAYSSYGLVMTSSDGTSWTGHAVLLGLSQVTYGAGVFVGIAGDDIVSSTDGLSWTIRYASSGSMSSVTFSWSGSAFAPNNMFVAVGYNNGIYSSPDGITWTPRTCPAALTGTSWRTVSAVQHFATLDASYMMVAAAGAFMCYSTNGTTWASVPNPGNGNFIASVADPSTSSIWVSDSYTGVISQVPYNFTTNTLGTVSSTSLGMRNMAPYYAGITEYTDAGNVRHIVALRSDGTLYDTTSASASGFTAIAPNFDRAFQSPVRLASIASNGSSLFMTGENRVLVRSDNGGGLLKIEMDDVAPTTDDRPTVAFRDGTTVVSRDDGALWTSTDGVTFTDGTTGGPSEQMLSLLQTQTGLGMFSISLSGAVTLSETTDEQTWTTADVQVALCPACMVYNTSPRGVAMYDANGYFMTLNGQEGAAIETVDTKGTTAAGFTSAVQTPYEFFAKLWSSGSDYYGLNGVAIMKSSDGGATWTQAATLPFYYATDYLDDGPIKYTVTYYGQVSTSLDGVTWSAPVQLDPYNYGFYAIDRMGDHVFAIGGDGMQVTTDGTTWTRVPLPVPSYLTSMTMTDRGFVIVGGTGTVITAP